MIIPFTLASRLACFGAGLVSAHVFGSHALADFFEDLARAHDHVGAVRRVPIEPIGKAIETTARRMMKNFEAARDRRGAPSPRDDDERRIMEKMEILVTRYAPSISDMIESHLDFDAVRRKVCGAIAGADPDDFAPDRLGGQIASQLLDSAFAQLRSDETFIRQLQLPLSRQMLDLLQQIAENTAVSARDWHNEVKLDDLLRLLKRMEE